MKIVIDIPKEMYENALNDRLCGSEIIVNAIKKGTPLDGVLNKIKAKFIIKYPQNYMGEPELGGASCVFSLNKVLEIIDSYRKAGE